MKYFKIIYLLVICLFFIGCATIKLVDYEPKSDEEKDVLDFMVECDEAFQNKNMEKYSDCFHEDAKIVVMYQGSDTRTTISKQTFNEDFLMQGRGPFTRQILVNPKITVDGNKAIVSCKENGAMYSMIILTNWGLVKEGGRWYIESYTW